VRIATDEPPRETPAASLKVTNNRLVPGWNGISPVAEIKTAKVRVSPLAEVKATVLVGGDRQTDVTGLVSQTKAINDNPMPPSLAENIRSASLPIAAVATAMNVLSEALLISATPLALGVSAMVNISAGVICEEESEKVLTPNETPDAGPLSHITTGVNSSSVKACEGVTAKTKFCTPRPPGIITGVLFRPTG